MKAQNLIAIVTLLLLGVSCGGDGDTEIDGLYEVNYAFESTSGASDCPSQNSYSETLVFKQNGSNLYSNLDWDGCDTPPCSAVDFSVVSETSEDERPGLSGSIDGEGAFSISYSHGSSDTFSSYRGMVGFIDHEKVEGTYTYRTESNWDNKNRICEDRYVISGDAS